MIKNERFDSIMEILKREKYSTPDKLSKMLYVSPVTIRRDLKKFESDGLVSTCYGGVSIVTHDNRDVPLCVRENFNENIKLSLAKRAAKLITNGSTVFLDASSTVSFIANFLEPEQDITVITNGIKALTTLSQRHIKAYCTGGKLIDNSLAFTGAIALKTVKGMNADFMFFSSQGLGFDGKITDFSESETELRCAMLERARQKYFLCDNSKLGKTYLFEVCCADELDGVICDRDYKQIPDSEKERHAADSAMKNTCPKP